MRSSPFSDVSTPKFNYTFFWSVHPLNDPRQEYIVMYRSELDLDIEIVLFAKKYCLGKGHIKDMNSWKKFLKLHLLVNQGTKYFHFYIG